MGENSPNLVTLYMVQFQPVSSNQGDQMSWLKYVRIAQNVA
jgi:hypothetical protein